MQTPPDFSGLLAANQFPQTGASQDLTAGLYSSLPKDPTTGAVATPPDSPGMTDKQRAMMASILQKAHPAQQAVPQLDLGQVNGIGAGGGVTSQYGTV